MLDYFRGNKSNIAIQTFFMLFVIKMTIINITFEKITFLGIFIMIWSYIFESIFKPFHFSAFLFNFTGGKIFPTTLILMMNIILSDRCM